MLRIVVLVLLCLTRPPGPPPPSIPSARSPSSPATRRVAWSTSSPARSPRSQEEVHEGRRHREPARAGGSLAVAEMVQAKPDGYTVILAPLSTLVIHPQLNDLPYKTPDDYEPIINVVSFYSLLAVKADAPWKTVQEFVAAAKASPGKLRVGSPGEGTSSHLNLEEMKRLAGIERDPRALLGLGRVEPGAARRPRRGPDGPAGRGQAAGGRRQAAGAHGVPGQAPPGLPRRAVREGARLGHRRPAARGSRSWRPRARPVPCRSTIHDAVKAAMDEPQFVNTIKQRVIDIDYRAGDQLRADLWKEYKSHTEVLTRLGMIKKK